MNQAAEAANVDLAERLLEEAVQRREGRDSFFFFFGGWGVFGDFSGMCLLFAIFF